MLTIISGGQTGIDRMALDAAIELQVAHGGWCPRNRRSEDGPIHDKYNLQCTESRNYAVRTKQNIVDSDGTLVFHPGEITGGTQLTIKYCQQLKKPLMVIGAEQLEFNVCKIGESTLNWLKANQVLRLNVAGPRYSTAPELADQVCPFFKTVIKDYAALLSNQ